MYSVNRILINVKCCFNTLDLDFCRLGFFFSSFPFSSLFLSLFLYLLSFLIPFFYFTLTEFYFCCLNHKTLKPVETIHVLNFLQTVACGLKWKHSFPVQKQTIDVLKYVSRRRHTPDSKAACTSDTKRSSLPQAQVLFLHFWQYQAQDEQRQW